MAHQHLIYLHRLRQHYRRRLELRRWLVHQIHHRVSSPLIQARKSVLAREGGLALLPVVAGVLVGIWLRKRKGGGVGKESHEEKEGNKRDSTSIERPGSIGRGT